MHSDKTKDARRYRWLFIHSICCEYSGCCGGRCSFCQAASVSQVIKLGRALLVYSALLKHQLLNLYQFFSVVRDPLPIVYGYDHCRFTNRVRLAMGVKNIKHLIHFLPNDDIVTPTELVGQKIAPIFVS